MKKFLIFAVIAAMLGCNTIAYAAEEAPKVEAGITPDSILYSADKLVEDLQLLFTTDSEKEAELLIQFANERLAEAKQMTEEEKTQFVEAAVKDYTELMNEAEEKVTEAAADESTTQEAKEELAQNLADAAVVDESIQNEVGTELQEQLEEETAKVSYTANVVKDLDVTVVQALREKGMGFGQIAHTIALSEASGKTVDEISALIGEGKGIGEIAKELGVHPSKINNKKADATSDEETATETTKETTTETAAATDVNSTDQTNTSESKVEAATATTTINAVDKNISKAVTTAEQKVTAPNEKSNSNAIKTDSQVKITGNSKNDKTSKGKK